MPRGFSLPIRTSRRGGARLSEGSPYAKQVIMTGLTSNTSRNPFQRGDGIELGISEGIVFSNNVPAIQSRARREIQNFFTRARSEEVAKLANGTDGLAFSAPGEELIATIRYVELEADREDVLETDFKDALRSSPGNVGGES